MSNPNTHRIVFLAAFLLIAAAPSVRAQEKAVYDAQAETLFNKALAAYESENYAEASKVFEAVAKRKPIHQKSTAAYLMGARGHIKSNNPQAAIDLLTPFFIRFPSSMYQGEAILLVADAQTAAGKYMDAFKSYSVGLSVTTDRDQKEDLLVHLQGMLEKAKVTREQFNALVQKVDDEIARGEIEGLWSQLDFSESRVPVTQRKEVKARNAPPLSSTRRFIMVFPHTPPTDVHQSIIDEVRNGIATAMGIQKHENGCRVDSVTYLVSTLDSLRTFIRSLQDDRSVMGIIGGAFSADARMLVKATAGSDIPVILPTATASDLATGEEVFQLNVPFDVRGRVLAQYVRNTLKARTVAILAPLRSFARDIAEAFKTEARRIGLAVDIVSWYRPGTDDMSRQFHTLRTRQFGDSIDVLFAPVESPADIPSILVGVQKSGVTNFILGAGDWAYPDTIAPYISPNIRVEFATEYEVDMAHADYKKFEALYVRNYGAAPSKHAVFGYDAAGILLRSLCEAPGDREAVHRDLLTGYTGLHSLISLSPQRQNTALSIMRYTNGGFKKVTTIQEIYE